MGFVAKDIFHILLKLSRKKFLNIKLMELINTFTRNSADRKTKKIGVFQTLPNINLNFTSHNSSASIPPFAVLFTTPLLILSFAYFKIESELSCRSKKPTKFFINLFHIFYISRKQTRAWFNKLLN